MKKENKFFILLNLFWLGLFFCGDYCQAVTIKEVNPGEDIFRYLQRFKGKFNQSFYQQVIGAASPYKEADQAQGLAANEPTTRAYARMLLSNTKIKDIHEHPLFIDNQQKLIWETTDKAQYEKIKDFTVGELKKFLLTKPEEKIKEIMNGLNSDVIACVTKIMSNGELCVVGKKVFNPLPGSNLGAKGYLGARIQPNSPTDNPEDIIWQVFDAWSYAVGDLVIGTNPVSDSWENIATLEKTLKDLIITFDLKEVIPWCVLTHVDKQYEVEQKEHGVTALWFQGLGGCDQANQSFDITIEKIMDYAKLREGKYGLYHETGQGADLMNHSGNGFDVVTHESRKYGLSRALKMEISKAAPGGKAWSHINDVAGFMGPGVFKTREQLVRTCLEDIVMGKLHGLMVGLDICTTLQMPVSLNDLTWCIDQIMPANPGYLMAVPAKRDPMMNYFTTSFQDHIRIRHVFGYKVTEAMWGFFKRIGIVNKKNQYTDHFGDPLWVYYQYRKAKGDKRSQQDIFAEGEAAIKRVESRGVLIARGQGKRPWDLNPTLNEKITILYNDAKACLWSQWTPGFIKKIPHALVIATASKDRRDYLVHPPSGEQLNKEGLAALGELQNSWGGESPDVQVVISDGLNPKALMEQNHLFPYLHALAKELRETGYAQSKKTIVVKNGRVRAGYAIGSVLFARDDFTQPKALIHIIGERPETVNHTYSVYIAVAKGRLWAKRRVDNDMVRVINGISDTTYAPAFAAKKTVEIIKELYSKP